MLSKKVAPKQMPAVQLTARHTPGSQREKVILSSWCTNRARFSRLDLLLLGVALSVFAWGLQYKLSLYDSPQSSSREVVQAKLLSKDENSSPGGELVGVALRAAAFARGAALETLLIAAFLLLLCLQSPASTPVREAVGDRPGPQRPYWGLPAFFFRPPPIFL